MTQCSNARDPGGPVPTRRSTLLGMVAGLCVLGGGSAFANTYPTKAVTLVVPFAPGGATDVLGRVIADRLGNVLGQPFVVKNQGGAGGNVGALEVARAQPDGYTLLMAAAALAVNQTLYKNLQFNALRDLEPVSLVALIPNVLVTNPSVPASSLTELIAYAKQNPGKLNYGSPGPGTIAHLGTEMLCAQAGIKMNHIPFRGSAPAVSALLGGHIDVMLDNLPPLAPYLQGGRLRVLGLGSAQRHPSFPDIPTISEAGLPGFEAVAWQSLLAPARTPPDIVKRLSAEVRKGIEDPDVRKRIEQTGAIARASTPAEFRSFLAAEVEKWGAVVRSSGATPD